jgi:predicted DNA-binding protein
MIATLINFTEEESAALENIARRIGKSQSELVREAVNQFITQFGQDNRLERLQRASGMWKDRTDLPALKDLRAEWDRATLEY